MLLATSIVTSAVLLLLGRNLAFAQEVTTGATCSDTFDWASNSLDQSPCLVASYLLSPCTGGSHSVPALAPNQHYVGPSSLSQASECQCNTVTYSALAGCGLCQNRTALNWSTYSYQCRTVHRGSYPLDIPPGTAVPAWAFLDISHDTFNLEEAQRLANSTDAQDQEHRPVPPASATSASESPTSDPTSLSSTSEAAPPTSTSNENSNAQSQASEAARTDKIIGGVLGGSIGLAVVLGAVLILLHHQKRKKSDDAQSLSSNSNDGFSPAPETKQVPGSVAVV